MSRSFDKLRKLGEFTGPAEGRDPVGLDRTDVSMRSRVFATAEPGERAVRSGTGECD